MASVITCRKCGTENAADSRYCDQCSAPLQAMPPMVGADGGPAPTVDLRGSNAPGTASRSRAVLPPPITGGQSSLPVNTSTTLPLAGTSGDNLTTVPLDSASVAPGAANARVLNNPPTAAPVTTPIRITPMPVVSTHAPTRRNNSGFLVIGGVVLAVIIFLGGLASLAGNVINLPPTATVAPTMDLHATISAILAARDAEVAANLAATETALPQGASGDAGRATALAQATVERATAEARSASNELATQAAAQAAATATAQAAGVAANAAEVAVTQTAVAAQQSTQTAQQTATAAQHAIEAGQQATQQAAARVADATNTAAANAGQATAHKTATSAAIGTHTAVAVLAAQQAVTRTALAALSGAQAATAGVAATKAAAQQATAGAAQQATAAAAQQAQQGTATANAVQAATQQAAAAGTAAAHSAAQTATAAVPVAWAPHNVRFFASAVAGCGAAPSSNFNYPQVVFVQVAMDDAPAGTHVDVIWSGGEKNYTHTDTQTPANEVRPACFDGYSLDPTRSGIGPGTYQVSLRVNGDTLKTITVQIAGPPATPTSAVWVPRNVRAFTSAQSGCTASPQTVFNYPAVVAFQVALDDAPAGTKVEVTWSGGFDNYNHTDSQTNANDIRPACYEGFSLDTGRPHIGPGSYTLTVRINGATAKTLQFTVNGPPPSATPVPAAPPTATPPHPTATTAPAAPTATTAPAPTAGSSRPPHLYEVAIRSSGFSPHEIGDAHVGDTVRFTNLTTQTQITIAIHVPNDSTVENGIGKEDSWDYTLTVAGTYNYSNKFNGGQTGLIIVSP